MQCCTDAFALARYGPVISVFFSHWELDMGISRRLMGRSGNRRRIAPAVMTIVLLFVVLAPSFAWADFVWDMRVGAKGAFTGNLYSEPEAAPLGSDAYWGDTQFYIGGGGGIFIEVNFLGYVGIEVDVLYEANSLTYGIEISGFEYDYITSFEQIRIPILIKGTLPLGLVELSLGIGPELVFGQSAAVEFEYHTQISDAQRQQIDQQLRNIYGAESTDGTFFDIDLGFNFKVWKLVIPLSLRVGINLDQPPDYYDRVTLDLEGNVVHGAKVKAIESIQFALTLGIGYVF